MQLDIPGGIATLRDKVDVRGRQALDRTLPAALGAIRKLGQTVADREELGETIDEDTPAARVGLTEAETEAVQRFQNAAVVAFLKNWSLDETVPRTIDEVLDMDPDVYTVLAKATSPLAIKAVRRPATNVDSGIKKDGTPDPDSPTGPSTGSVSGERAPLSTQTGQSTTSSPSDTTSTGIEGSSPA